MIMIAADRLISSSTFLAANMCLYIDNDKLFQRNKNLFHFKGNYMLRMVKVANVGQNDFQQLLVNCMGEELDQ